MTDPESVRGLPEKPAGPPLFSGKSQPDPASPSGAKFPAFKRFFKAAGKRNDSLLNDSPVQPLNPKMPRERKRHAWYWTAAAALLLLTGGLAVGATIPDPTKSEAYAELNSEKEKLSSDLAALQSRHDSLADGIRERENDVAAREAEVATAEADNKTAAASLKKREEAVSAAEKAKAAKTVKEGTWTVGTDIEPGTYRTTSEVSSGSCYWEINRTGSNGGDIIENDIVSGGRPSVTLSIGQDFTTTRCGSWLRQ